MIDSRYLDYVRSEEWAKKAEQRRAIDGHKCAMCGSTERLHVHHLHYRTLRNEDVEKDLITLCEACHRDVHKDKGDLIAGVLAAYAWLKAEEQYGGIEGVLGQLGIHRAETVEKFKQEHAAKMKMLYLPLPSGGAFTIPYREESCEKDTKKLFKLIGEDYEREVNYGWVHEVYYMAQDLGAYVEGGTDSD